jgi:hypothetical protein
MLESRATLHVQSWHLITAAATHSAACVYQMPKCTTPYTFPDLLGVLTSTLTWQRRPQTQCCSLSPSDCPRLYCAGGFGLVQGQIWVSLSPCHPVGGFAITRVPGLF